jgi:hypothetical protein
MKALTIILLIALMVSPLVLAVPVKAQEPLNLIIKPDGSVSPATNLLERNGSKYTFTGDIFGNIWVQTGHLTIDGAGYTLQVDGGNFDDSGIMLAGPDLSKRDCREVLVENLRINNGVIYSVGASNNSFIGNYLDQSSMHLQGSAADIGNLIKHNTFKNGSIFVDYNRCGLDVITENNFVNSLIFVDLSDAPVADRNYWSNYTVKYPDAKELDNSGVGDTPYVNDNLGGTNTSIDYHPLVNPVADFEIPAFNDLNATPTPSTPTASPTPTSNQPTINPALLGVTLLVVSVVVAVGAAVLVRKRRVKQAHL